MKEKTRKKLHRFIEVAASGGLAARKQRYYTKDDFVPGWHVETSGRFVLLVKTHPEETGSLLPDQARRLARMLDASADMLNSERGP